jgi:hypothetical protein
MTRGWAAIGYLSPCAESWFLSLVAPSNGTETFPSSERGYFGGTHQVTALGIHGTGIELAMLAGRAAFTLGRAESCDLRAERRYLAPTHARIERLSNSNYLRITNISSGKNEIAFKNAAQKEFHIGPGDTFQIADTTYYALTEEMRLARPIAMEVFGAKRYAAIDDLLIAAVADSDRHIVLLGHAGSDQERLGQAIHEVSLRRGNRFVLVPPTHKPRSADLQTIRDARGGTILIWLPIKGKFDPQFTLAVLQPQARVRLIICAHSLNKADASFPAAVVSEAKQIAITPLHERRNEIARLLDHWFVECRSVLRFAALTEPNRDTLLAYRWPGNLQELRAAADHLVHLAHYRSERQAANDTHTSRSASRRWRKSLGLRLPLLTTPMQTT